ncbi:unnamed protein product [Phytophthora lilii]|uniref:Unnamed protein product n=1 Tax=Phytophthora lilii TaxID=2077276 RepID=A0A9W6TBT7_9STRA|nr:unnamed protein product [Phytophthora lilii]
MEMSSARAGPAQQRRPNTASRSRQDKLERLSSIDGIGPVSLADRLNLNWKSIPAKKEAKLYAPSANKLSDHAGNNKAQNPMMAVQESKNHNPPPTKSLKNVASRPGSLLEAHVAAFEQRLTRFKGGQGIEFSDLAGWVDEKRAFDHMTNMKGLERIQQMIFFFSWKRQAVQRRVHRVQERLACSLFTCHPVASRLLMDVRDVCAEIESEAEREYVEPNTVFTLDHLRHIHQERASIAKCAISKKIDVLCGVIDEATRELSRYKEAGGRGYAITDHESFSKALRLSSLRERMFIFLRLVDFHIAEAVYLHVAFMVRDIRARVCGVPTVASCSPVIPSVEDKRSMYLHIADDTRNLTSPGRTCQVIEYTVQPQESDALKVTTPGLYLCLEDDVDFKEDVDSAKMQFTPAKAEVLELVHSIFLKYCVAMDGLPRVLTNSRFEHVLTPFVPTLRREFSENLLKSSHLALESYEPELREIRTALDLHFRRIGILQQEHLRCVRAIKVAEHESPVEATKRDSTREPNDNEDEDEDTRLSELPDLATSAAAYELAKKTWNRFVQYADSSAPILQVGFLLFDQSVFVDKLRSHISNRVAEMDDALPSIYQQFLTSLLEDVDGRIEKVTKIPTNLAEANIWLAQVTSMMSTHPFRQHLDMKIDNLARLKALIKERGLMSFEPELQDSIRKLELTWESVIETLLMCLARVEERGSEHRRSVQDVVTKVDEYVTGQLQRIVKTFEALPSGCEKDDEVDEDRDHVDTHDDPSTKEELVQQLEDLVSMDLERKNVVHQFEEYDREHRAIMDMPPLQQIVWASSVSSSSSDNLSAVSITDKLPSELLLLYIVTSLELRQWFDSWLKMRDKWLGSPLTGVHPGTMINRIKPFRRRLGYASSRLSRLSSVLVQTLPIETSGLSQQFEDEDKKGYASFAKKDFELMRAFDSSIEDMLNCNRIFQAISSGAFSEARWATMHQLLNVQIAPTRTSSRGHLTLRDMKKKCDASQINAFLEVCDECIVEAKLHMKLEQARQRLARIEVRVEETNYSVRCEGVAEALAQLDEIAIDLKLCLFHQNPKLQLCLELRTELEHKVTICEHIMGYQKYWRLKCEATKLHEIDEFFSKRFSGGGGVDFAIPRSHAAQHKTGIKQEQTVWQAFLDASHGWSDRLRRLFFVKPHQAQTEQVKLSQRGKKSSVPVVSASTTLHGRLSTATKSMDCTLDDVVECFDGFEFEANLTACERGVELVRNYLELLQEKTPRLYCLDEDMMLQLLLRDSDMQQLHQSLAICFPRVHRFAMSLTANRVGSTIEPLGKQDSSPSMPVRASRTDGTIVIVGIEGMQENVDVPDKSGRFRLPVAKIGRVKFWFTRLEEEMSSMVLTDTKHALEWMTYAFDCAEFAGYDSLLPQSIATACGLRFTYNMNKALQQERHQRVIEELHLIEDTTHKELQSLAALRRADKKASFRLESMILLSNQHARIVRQFLNLAEQGQEEEARFFWGMQFQTRAFVEITSTPSSTTQPSPGKHLKRDKFELFPTGPEFLKTPSFGHTGQSVNMTVYCQVAHLQIPLGQEFVGWGRLATISPFTQRCIYALFSALRMHHTALVVPYNVEKARKDPSTILWGIAQMLMKPCIEVSCQPSAGIAILQHLENLMDATSKLNGFLIVRHLLQLSSAMISTMQARMLQHFHQAPPSGNCSVHHSQQLISNSLVLPRFPGGASYRASAIFIPLESPEDLERSRLMQSVRTQFRAVAVTRPALQYVVELMLAADGFMQQQVQELNVIEAFKAIGTMEAGSFCALNAELLIARVVLEAQRLGEDYRVVWDLNPVSAGGSAMKTLFQSRQSVGSNVSSGNIDIREGQTIFRHAFMSAIETLIGEWQRTDLNVSMELVNSLLARAFPESKGGRLVSKSKGDEEAVAAAVSIYLESALSLPGDCEQFKLIMELWRALQRFPAALVCGPPGSGKTTCVTALHRALIALDLSEQNQENENGVQRNSLVRLPSAMTQLIILNPQLLTHDQLYTNIATACRAVEDENAQTPSSIRSFRWILVDGEVDGGVLDRLLECDNRAIPSKVSLPSSSVWYRGSNRSVLSGDCADSNVGPRIFFERVGMIDLSPSALCRCWNLQVPASCITVSRIINAWRTRWESQLVFPSESRGFQAMVTVFGTVDVLISRVCVSFTNEEIALDPSGETKEATNSGVLSLGYLPLNHVTQTALSLVSYCCFQNKQLLQELSYFRLVELTAFAVLWGFCGHLVDSSKHKLENYVRAKSKEYSEIKHLAELPRGLLDANHFDDVWDELQPRFTVPLSLQPFAETNSRTKPEIRIESTLDPVSGQILVLVPAATSLLRICMLLLHSSHSFLLVGPAASGKTSLLRWIIYRNREAETAEMKIETSLDERHVHGILDWMAMPAAWFRPFNQNNCTADCRAKMREETELFAGRAKHSFVFFDDLDASGEITNKSQVHFVRTMLDHRMGYSSKHGGFLAVEKHVGAGMRIEENDSQSVSPALARFMRHFTVLRAPTYSRKELLSVFRIKFQHHFRVEPSRRNTERRLSAKGGMGGAGSSQQLPIEEVILRASIDFASEMAVLQQQELPDYPSFLLFNLHHLCMLLERSLSFAASVSGSKRGDANQRSEGTTLVMLGKAHQSWLSELQNVFLSSFSIENPTISSQTIKISSNDETQKKISALLRYLSEKYFSVAFRGSNDHSFSVPVEALHFLVKLAEHHAQAPLLQPRLIQLRELLNEQMTAASGASRRSSDQGGGASTGNNSSSAPIELVSSALLEIAANTTNVDPSDAPGYYTKRSHRYSCGQLSTAETTLLLGSSWCLSQVTHLVHALGQQQNIVVTSSLNHRWLLPDRLLRLACDIHGYKVFELAEKYDEEGVEGDCYKQVIQHVLGSAGVRQERVALWVREHQLKPCHSSVNQDANNLVDIFQELCQDKLPSLALLPGGEELRDELVLSCIQDRKSLEVVTEVVLMTEFQRRLQQNLRLCIFEEANDDRLVPDEVQTSQSIPHFINWMKTKPSCHWRRLVFSGSDLQRLISEVTKAVLTSPKLCGLALGADQAARYLLLFQNVHLLMMCTLTEEMQPSYQLDYFLSFMVNTFIIYDNKTHTHRRKIDRLESNIKTLSFARDKIVPSLERRKQTFESELAEIVAYLNELSLHPLLNNQSDDSEGILDNVLTDEEVTADPIVEESQWALRSNCEELKMKKNETTLRLEEVSRFLAEWYHVADRTNGLYAKWTQELAIEKSITEAELLGVAIYVGALRGYSNLTAQPTDAQKCLNLLKDFIAKNVTSDHHNEIGEWLDGASTENDTDDDNIEITHLIWTSRFPFLYNADIHRTVRLADALCDRIPVFVDPSGVFQRFLVHIFSGHTLFSTLPCCGTAGEVESDNPSATKESMVLSCDDPKLELLLQDAQRLAVPVLLINFRSYDAKLLDRLQPFMNHQRLSHAPPRRPMLRELTVKYYEDQRKQKQRRTSIAGSAMAAMSSLAQTAASVGGGAALMTRRAVRAGKHKAMTIEPMSVAAAVSSNMMLGPVSSDLTKMPDRRDVRGNIPATTSSTRCFQIYAVTATPVQPATQHSLVGQLSHFSIALPNSELETLVQQSWIGKTQPRLLQELRGDQIGLADCWVKMIQNRVQLNQLLVNLTPSMVDREDSPFVTRKTNRAVTIQLQESYSELALQFANDYHAELIWCARKLRLKEKNAELACARAMFAPTSIPLVDVARCIRIMTSLRLRPHPLPFYPQNFRYLEAASQPLEYQGDETVQFSVKAIMARISTGFVSDSHRYIFSLLQTLTQQQRIQESLPNDEVQSAAWKDAVVWLISNSVRKTNLDKGSLEQIYTNAEKHQVLGIFPGCKISVRFTGGSGTSLVERLRRRVKLCAYLFNGWKASRSNKDPRGKRTAPRPLPHTSMTATPGRHLEKPISSHSGSNDSNELAIDQLQQSMESLLAASEALWYEWKTSRVRLQLDLEHLLRNLGYHDVSALNLSERNNTILPCPVSLVTLDGMVANLQLDRTQTSPDEPTGLWRQSLVNLLVAKTLFPANFSNAVVRYLNQNGNEVNPTSILSERKLTGPVENEINASTAERWTKWPSPASLVADIAPSRGKHSRTHLPRALILYLPGERNDIELMLSCWDIAVFVDAHFENTTLRDELIMLVTTKHKFVLELLDAKDVEAALTLVSQIINEHALLSVPEWYLLTSFAVARAINNAILAIVDRIAVYSSESQGRLRLIVHDSCSERTTEKIVQHKLVDEHGTSDATASALTSAVLLNHTHKGDVSRFEEVGSVTTDLEDIILHVLAIDEVSFSTVEREQMIHKLLQLLHGSYDQTCDRTDATMDTGAKISAEILSDLVSVGELSLETFADKACSEWLQQHTISKGGVAYERLWSSFCQIRAIFESVHAVSEVSGTAGDGESSSVLFFPWCSFTIELANQYRAFEAINKSLATLRAPSTFNTESRSELWNQQQMLASFARGYIPFEMTQRFFNGTGWPRQASGTVSIAQMLLLITCRVGVLVRCLRGDRAWALNLAVVSDACGFIRELRMYTATQQSLPESELMLVVELDSTLDVVDPSTAASEEEQQKRKALAIAKRLGAVSSVDESANDWHGAVLQNTDSGSKSWGIRVDGLTLIEKGSSTKLYPLPMCRVTCQPRTDTMPTVEVPMLILPSMSSYQPTPTISQDLNIGVRVVLGRSINSIVDMEAKPIPSEPMQYAIGVTVFPDDDINDNN